MPAPLGHILDASTLHLWRLDEASGATFVDEANPGLPGLDGSIALPDLAAGVVGNARRFNGGKRLVGNQGRVATIAAALKASWTIELWAMQVTRSAQAGLISWDAHHAGGGDANGVLARVFLHSDGDLNVLWTRYAPSEAYVAVESPAAAPKLALGQWYHLAVSKQLGGDGTSVVRLFVNGAKVHEAAGVLNATGGTSASCRWSIGALNPGWDPFDGRIDDVRVSTVARSEADILLSYQRGAGIDPAVLTFAEARVVGWEEPYL